MKNIIKLTESQVEELYKKYQGLKESIEHLARGIVYTNVSDIETYEDACNFLEENPINEEYLISYGVGKSEIAFIKLKTIFRAINKINNNWKPDFTNINQVKYCPYFSKKYSRLIYIDTLYISTATTIPSSLYCGNHLDAMYIGQQFIDLYEDYLCK